MVGVPALAGLIPQRRDSSQLPSQGSRVRSPVEGRAMDEKEIFLAAVIKSPRSEQGAYVRQACGADQALRSRVLALLEAHNAALDLCRPSQPGLPLTKSDGTAAT